MSFPIWSELGAVLLPLFLDLLLFFYVLEDLSLMLILFFSLNFGGIRWKMK